MRRVRYSVVMSLDGYIAGPNGEADWIIQDPDFDFSALFRQFDTILVGRRTFDTMVAAKRVSLPGMKTIVFSRTLRQKDNPEVVIVSEQQRETVVALKTSPGKDIWLFGGGSLFRSLADDGLVDTVEVRLAPVLLGAGVPLLAIDTRGIQLTLTAHAVSKAGIVSLDYAVVPTLHANQS